MSHLTEGETVQRYAGVFTHVDHSDDRLAVDVWAKASEEATALRLLGADARYVRLNLSTYSLCDLYEMSRRIQEAAAALGVVVHAAPDPVLDGVRACVTDEPSLEVKQLLIDELTPLGLVRLGNVALDVPILPIGRELDVYIMPGEWTDEVGRQWRTECEQYSSKVARCRTEIKATVIKQVNGRFVQTTDWAFNNLTYIQGTRAEFAHNPLGFTNEWTVADGRRWKTECDTPRTGRNGCRSYAEVSFVKVERGRYVWTKDFVFNNLVRFS